MNAKTGLKAQPLPVAGKLKSGLQYRFGVHILHILAIFVIALLPRLPGLSRFLTSDENTNLFLAGSDVIKAFLDYDWRNTYWHFYPGVTMSWLDALGMGGQYLLEWVGGKSLPPFEDYIYGDILTLLAAVRLPYAILTAAAIPVFYVLAGKLVDRRVALTGALFLAFDPFFLAHSRVAHGDAPVTVFMSLSALTFFLFVRQVQAALEAAGREASAVTVAQLLRQPYLIASAILGGLAALTKAPGQFMALFVTGFAFLQVLYQLWAASQAKGVHQNYLHYTRYLLPRHLLGYLTTPGISPYGRNDKVDKVFRLTNLRFTFYVLRFWLGAIAVWGLVSLATFILLWPAMWVDPVGTFGQMWWETFSKVNEGHLVYFLGQPTLDPGPWFYPYVIPFRLTPVVLVGAVLSLLFFLPKFRAHLFMEPVVASRVHGVEPLGGTPAKASTPSLAISRTISQPGGFLLSPYFFLWLFVISLLLFGNLSPKKQDRYLLALFPFLNLLAACGWAGLIAMINDQLSMINRRITNYQLPITNYPSLVFNLSFLLLLLFQFIPVLTYYPYYLTYFNPLLGGPTRAAQTTLMGWGEGMEQVAAYLNQKPEAEKLYVASTPSQTLLPYFAGTGENFYTNDIAFRADYVVLYLAQMQRLAPSPEIVHYFESRQPEKTIMIHDVTYAKIYPGPKYIGADIPATATPANIGLENILRLAGYELSSADAQPIIVTLYWHALAPLSTNYTISVRAWAADKRLLIQQDQWPVEGLLPTTQWRQGDYVTDIHRLDLPAGSEVDHFEIVVYQADSGAPLGPPVTISNEQ